MSLLALRPLLVKQRVLSHALFRCSASLPTLIQHYSTSNASKQTTPSKSLSAGSDRTDVSTDVRPIGERVKENTKTASYMGVILLGVGVTGILFYVVFWELFSSDSPNNIYSEALERVKEEPRVKDALGAPIKGYGEESRRGRRTRVAHTKYVKDGVEFIRMQFHVQGFRNRGTVHLEKRKTESGGYEYRYLFVQLDYNPHSPIILEDNRLQQDAMRSQAGALPQPFL
ncbi:mitochondrial import inner membrane translocase subunit Tim21 [Anopheles stephensi]|uniref:mitochondrial import inner membrane translocase subunit Tim21 n=1 Tax=Anopheles stephensi TaxID=30069 RepID=UPI0016587816|nr:mitochondrial import inner membrane translocase subunit Tim21 [Anopheles stephensi]XP_035912912.1 mitochondrial import inner membrane translocase subunit Tim21 [Anopheles stephensi]XP_035912913.1 mitochondrial import inner membrane translocase subunit Tim21 [Anopheles stephensi]